MALRMVDGPREGRWNQLCLFTPLEQIHMRRIGHERQTKAYDFVETLMRKTRLETEYTQWGGRWVALLMAGYFDCLIAPQGYRITGISVHWKGADGVVRLTCGNGTDGKVAFYRDKRQKLFKGLFYMTAQKDQLVWKEDKFYTPTT